LKKWLSLAVAVAALATVITGCTGGVQPKSIQGASVGSSPSDAKVTIKLLQTKIEITDQVKAMADDYMKQHPNVNLEAQVVTDLGTLLKTRFASGDEPDMFYTSGFTGMSSWADTLLDLSNEPWMSKVSPAAVPGMTVNGQKLGFPLAFEGFGVIYNKDLFSKAGIDKLPTTFTELKQANEKLKAAGIPSYTEAYKEQFTLYHLLNLPFAYEKDPIAYLDKLSKGQAKISDMSNMDGFFIVVDLAMKYGKGSDSIGVSYDNQVADFASGKTAMMHQGVWTIGPIQKVNPNINMGMFAIPLNDNVAETKLSVAVPGYYVVNKNSKHIDECKKFLTWLHDNGQKYMVDSFKFIPAFTDLKTTPALGPLAMDMSTYVEKNQTIPWAFRMWPSGFSQDFSKPLQAYVAGQMKKDQVVQELQKIWDAGLKK
jgi:raffinose/stachyose/melibiose transport system substrate-binding protein